MGVRQTLQNIIGSALVMGSTILGSNSAYAQTRESNPKPINVEYIDLTPADNSFSKKFPVQWYQRQAAKEVKVGEGSIVVEGELDYDSGKLNLAYSSGRIGKEGPDLSRFSRKEQGRLPVSRLVPRLNDNETAIYVVSPAGRVLARDNSQEGYFYPGDDIRELVDLEDSWEKKLLMEKSREGFDKLLEFGDGYVASSGIPFASKIKPFQRMANQFEKYLAEERRREQRNAESTLERGVSSERIPLKVDSRRGVLPDHMIGRSIKLDFLNPSDNELPVVVYIKRIGIGDRTDAYAEIKDIALTFNLPKNDVFYLGGWKMVDSIPQSESFLEDIDERQGLITFEQNTVSIRIHYSGKVVSIADLRIIERKRVNSDMIGLKVCEENKKDGDRVLLILKKLPKNPNRIAIYSFEKDPEIERLESISSDPKKTELYLEKKEGIILEKTK